MSSEIRSAIKKDRLIWKFNFYGFFKNLTFFEPYLLLFLLSKELNLFQTGLLFSLRESVIYLFEIPSGILADKLGNKKELLICFLFYIVSFLFFAVSDGFGMFLISMFFYALGEAFRSGAHKSMIYSYLEKKNWFDHKSFVYGRTRSFSLLGSALSSLFSILFLYYFDEISLLFYFSTIPYIADFLLVLSYPNYLNETETTVKSFKQFYNESILMLKSIFKQKYMLRIVVSASSFEAFFSVLKDYIQPILLLLIGSYTFFSFSEKINQVELTLGIVYAGFYILSSIATRNSYRLRNYFSGAKLMNFLFVLFSFTLVLIGFSVSYNLFYFIVFLYLILFVLNNLRRPFFVDLVGDYLKKSERATVLSIESQSKSFFIVLFAPLIGFSADFIGIPNTMFVLSFLLFIIYKITRL